MGCILVSTSAGPFVGDGVALLTKDIFGDFIPLARRELETVLSAGYKIAVDLGSRMHRLAALAKASNQGAHALASIVLTQLQFLALPDKGAGARMNKAAAMLEQGASAAEVLKVFMPNGELAKFNPYHLGPGGGQFTTAEMDTASSGDTVRAVIPALPHSSQWTEARSGHARKCGDHPIWNGHCHLRGRPLRQCSAREPRRDLPQSMMDARKE
jgi:hypothetical protein